MLYDRKEKEVFIMLITLISGLVLFVLVSIVVLVRTIKEENRELEEHIRYARKKQFDYIMSITDLKRA